MKRTAKVILGIETSGDFGREILLGIARYARVHGPWSIYMEAGQMREAMLPNIFKKFDVDGIIIRDAMPKVKDEMISKGIPIIFCGHRIAPDPHFPVIKTDDMAIVKTGVDYLKNRGFRNIAFCGYSDLFWARNRAEVFSQKIKAADLQLWIYESRSSQVQRSWAKEERRIAEWLVSLPKPAAIMACHDFRGKHITEACKIAELNIPDEVAVLGIDNDLLACELSDIPISSIALGLEKAGFEAAALLDRLMQGGKMQDQTILIEPTYVVTRQSTDILALEDKAVAEAVRFIRKNNSNNLRVSDVAEAASLSRRSLEIKFRKALNRTVYGEIKRVRIEKTAQMLIESDLTIAQIALELGFTDPNHISQWFKEVKGIGPLAYRRSYNVKHL